MKDIRKETLMEVWQKWSNMDDLAFDQWLHTEMHKEQAGINCPVMRPASECALEAAIASEGQGEANTCADCGSKIEKGKPCIICLTMNLDTDCA